MRRLKGSWFELIIKLLVLTRQFIPRALLAFYDQIRKEIVRARLRYWQRRLGEKDRYFLEARKKLAGYSDDQLLDEAIRMGKVHQQGRDGQS